MSIQFFMMERADNERENRLVLIQSDWNRKCENAEINGVLYEYRNYTESSINCSNSLQGMTIPFKNMGTIDKSEEELLELENVEIAIAIAMYNYDKEIELKAYACNPKEGHVSIDHKTHEIVLKEYFRASGDWDFPRRDSSSSLYQLSNIKYKPRKVLHRGEEFPPRPRCSYEFFISTVGKYTLSPLSLISSEVNNEEIYPSISFLDNKEAFKLISKERSVIKWKN
ncbi:hypothetical protein ACFL1H_00475 [Nanoarchaeota archaeon]